MTSIAGKKTLITGAANGIGREIARKMAQENACLALLDRDREGLAAIAKEIRQAGNQCIELHCDLADESQIELSAKRLLKEWGTLQILVNNAGVGSYGPIHDLEPSKRRQVLAVNLNAPFALFQQFMHQLLNEEESHVVNVASILGLAPYAKTAAYTTSKYGLVGFTEALRADYARWGLGVTLVCPGFVQTDMIEKLPTETTAGEKLSEPPRWLTTTPAKVAHKIVRGIKRNKRLVLVTPLAHFLYHFKRLLPGTYDLVQNFQSSRIKKRVLGWFGWRKKKSQSDDHSQPAEENADTGQDRKAA